MMQVAFPYPVKLKSVTPELSGLRHGTFTNIDGEDFGRPTMNGFWRLDMSVLCKGVQPRMALSAFVTAMSGHAECVVPICVQWRPNDSTGRRLSGGRVGPQYTFDHTGFANDPFDGFTLRAPASHRDSFIDINKPELSQLWAGHFITLGDRLHQVVSVSAIDESETAIRVSLMPNIRGDHLAGEVVIVDQLRLRCRMESGDRIETSSSLLQSFSLSFVEAF